MASGRLRTGVDGQPGMVDPPRRNSTNDEVTLFLSGDVMTGRGIDQVLPHPCDPRLYEPSVTSALTYVELAENLNGQIARPVAFDYPWGDALGELERRKVDARIVNLETSVTRNADPQPKGINYRMSPENFPCIEAAGIDCCVLANNHVLDWGEPGLAETIATVEAAGIAVAGAGRTLDEATKPAILGLSGGRRVLVFAFASESSGVPMGWGATGDGAGVNLLPDLSPRAARQIAARIAAAKRPGDVVVASVHWGGNWGYAVPESQQSFARLLIDEGGVDIVHGHSSHHPKAMEVYGERLILYGCGDFLNDYEGISGYEKYRDDLVVMYLPTLRAGDGTLARLTMVPFQIRNFRLHRAARNDTAWLGGVLDRQCRSFDARVHCADDGTLELDRTGPPRTTGASASP
jgi:poly-gamma-glutamate synthesis protein (capsule biosynthesis protein)